jgi:DNA polymerase-3 subunit delta'
VSAPYPWQTPVWGALHRMRATLPHALLLHGGAGLGKVALARQFGYSLLCDQPVAGGSPCGHCQSCQWLAAGSHPDWRELHPASADEETEDGKPRRSRPDIKIDAIRELADFITLTSQRGGRRVVLLHPAEAMNMAAANALLKTLEEPPAQVVFLLVSHQPQRLLPTIRSRCHQLALSRPDTAVALGWLAEQGGHALPDLLAEAGGAPLLAQQWLDDSRTAAREQLLHALAQPLQLDALTLAGQLDKQHIAPERVLDWLQKWLFDLACVYLARQGYYFPAQQPRLQELAGHVSLPQLLAFQHRLAQERRVVNHPLGTRLLIETWLLGYVRLFAAAAVS